MSHPNGDGGALNKTEPFPATVCAEIWQSHIRVMLMEIEHCVLGLIAKGSLVIYKTIMGILSQALSILRNLYYDEVLKAKLHKAFEMEMDINMVNHP